MTPIQPQPDQHIIVARTRVACAAPVITWQESGLSFKRNRPRKQTHAVVLHWTGGENPAADVVRNMTARKASVHFYVDAQGVVWQFCDADRECGHAKGVNETSVGIEIQSRGNEDQVRLPKGLSRATVKEVIHGVEFTYSDFTPPQVVSVMTLVRALCDAYRLPLRAPVERDGSVVTSILSTKELADHRGILGHYHAHPTKYDPGARILRLIHEGEDDARA